MIGRAIEKLKNANRFLLVIGACGASLVGFELVAILYLAHYKAQLFDAYAADGIFQLLDPLRRLYEGQFFGRDFNYFFGPFTALIHYPIFLLFGHDLAAASFAEWLVSPTLLIVFFFLFSRILFPGKLSLQLMATWGTFKLAQWLLPGLVTPFNSTLGVRDIGPIILAYALWQLYRLDKTWHRLNVLWDLLVPVLTAFALLNGTEFGVAASGAIIITRFLFRKGPILAKVLSTCRLAIAVGLFVVVFASIISAGHPFSVLQYSFVSVPADQFWYFGGPPGQFVTSISQIFEDRTMQWDLGLLAVLSVVNVYLYRKKYSNRFQATTIVFFLLSSLFSMIPIFAIFEPALQTQPTQLYLVLIGFLTLSLVPYRILFKRLRKLKASLYIAKYSLLLQICGGILIVGATGYYLTNHIQNQEALHRQHIVALTNEPVVSGSYLSIGWAETYEAETQATAGVKGKDIWSLYTGLLDASKGALNPSSFDYIIHAVGKANRAKYIHSFETAKPQAVITLIKLYFPEESWLENETWPFFEQLYANYTPRTVTASAIVWRRNNKPWVSATTKYSNQETLGSSQQSSVSLPVPATPNDQDYRVFTVQLTYKASYALGKLPWLGKMPRYFVSTNSLSSPRSPVALPPYDTSFTFPVMVRGNSKDLVLRFSKYALIPGAQLQVSQVKWQQANIPASVLNTVNPPLN